MTSVIPPTTPGARARSSSSNPVPLNSFVTADTVRCHAYGARHGRRKRSHHRILQVQGSKSKHYFNDFLDLFPDKKPREVKKILSDLVKQGVIEYWSSGSTTMYGMKGLGKQEEAEEGNPVA